MFDGIIKAIQNGVKTESLEIQGKHFTTREVFQVPANKTVADITVKSLTGLVDYLENNTDGLDLGKLFIHVDTPNKVLVYDQVLDKFGDQGRRHCWISAVNSLDDFSFGRWYDQESFLIGLQTLFIQNEDLLNVISTISNLKASEEIINSDDGLTQEVVLQKRVTAEQVKVKNPVILQPIRTFTEIDQPASPFILRTKRDGDKIQAALYEADNGKWKNDARLNIKGYLAEHLWTEDDQGITILA